MIKSTIIKWKSYVIAWLIGTLSLIIISVFAASLLSKDNELVSIRTNLNQLDTKTDLQLSRRLQSLQILVHNPLVIKLLQKQSPHDNPEILALLNGIKDQTKASIIYIMQNDGTVVGCSVYGKNKTLTGKNYSFRPYFIQAMAGENVVYPALGVTTRKRGIYISIPVRSTNSNILGIAVLKTGLEEIDNLLLKEQEPTVLVLPNDVIFASNRSNWLYRTVKPLPSGLLKKLVNSKQFADEPLSPLAFNLDNNSLEISNKLYTIFNISLSIKGWRVIVCRNLEIKAPLFPIQKQFLIASFIIANFLLTIIVFLIKNIRQRQRTELKLASYQGELEYTIAKRTKELSVSNKRLKQANKLKSQFLANMSHEIRTPLNAIIGFTDMLLATNVTEEQKDYLSSVSYAGKSLLSIINDILDLSKIEAGKLDVKKSEFILQECLKSLCSVNHGRTQEKNLNLSVDFPEKLDRSLISDQLRLEQILTNLIGNAIKFTSEGEIKITAEIVEKTDKSTVIEFAVADTGIGIAKEKQQLIFDAFTQADGSITRNFGGTGLGLTISNQLIKILGGTMLYVSSEEGKGSKFYFSLPFEYGKPIKEMPRREEKKQISNDNTSYNILLVEDNLVNIKLASCLLEKLGHTVKVAENGKLGVESSQKENFDLIFMDMQMPVMDGLEATHAIRVIEKESHIHIPIIAMTANAMHGDKERCINAGMDDYITKPIKIDTVKNIISKYKS